jgi:hypothetical protein
MGMAKKKLLKKNILYLMVVNLPTDEEVARASQIPVQ